MDITAVQKEQAEQVGRDMRKHVDAIQNLIFKCADKDDQGRVIARAPLPLGGDELLALQGLVTLYRTADDFFAAVQRG